MDTQRFELSIGVLAAACTRMLAGMLCVAMLAGCATLKEGAKGFLGISTKILDEGRKTAITQEFDLDQQAGYVKIIEALGKMSSVVYHAQAPSMVAVYVTSQDTTPVGIYCTAQSATRIRVEVSSPSTNAKEYIAKRLFARLQGLDDPFEASKPAAKEEASQVKKVEVLPQPPSVKRIEENK